MKISDIITDKYKLRIPPTVYYELLADVQEVEEEQEQEHIIDKIRAEILKISSYKGYELGCVRDGYRIAMVNVLNIIDKYRAESGDLLVERKEWIYRTMPDEGVDFDKIEKALGFKLFIWQKTFITRGVFRQYGATTAICIRRLLQKNNPIDYRMRIAHAQELFERQEMIRIHDQLQAAGVEVCEILRPERKNET